MKYFYSHMSLRIVILHLFPTRNCLKSKTGKKIYKFKFNIIQSNAKKGLYFL